ncbi:hypothetical protein V6N12_069338 [Hibiscus sabdariffa]|uniref:Uncharacterized protein n=1 Tax=Hibiscus sabdariffa TaxID=183260 RepID=A0ABR2FDJ5_9ROSI
MERNVADCSGICGPAIRPAYPIAVGDGTATFSEAPADVRGLVDGEKPLSGVERVGLPEDGAIPYDPGGGINIC